MANTNTVSKMGSIKHLSTVDFDITLDRYNNWRKNPTGTLQVTPTLERIFYLRELDGSVNTYGDLLNIPKAELENLYTYSTNMNVDVNGTIYKAGTYYYDLDTNTWEFTETIYSLYKYNKMFISIAEAALVDVTANAETLLYIDIHKDITTSQLEYVRDAIQYQIYHIVNNGLEENENDFQMSGGMDVQQGENTKQLIWEGIHSKVLTLIDISKINEIDIAFDENGGVIALKPINVTVKGTVASVANLPKDASFNDAYWVGGKLYTFDLIKWIASPSLVGKTGPMGPQGKGGPSWLTDNYADLQDFINRAPNNEKVKYNINADGTNNVKGYTELIKIGGNLLQIITKEELDLKLNEIEVHLDKKVQITSEGANLPNGVTLSYNLVKGSDGHVYALVPFMTEAEWIKNVNDTMAAKDKADKNALDIAKKQNNLEMDLNNAPFGKIISTDAILTSNKVDGSRKIPSYEFELTDKKYVDDEIAKHSGGGASKVKKYIQGGILTEVVPRLRAVMEKGIQVMADTDGGTQIVYSAEVFPIAGIWKILYGEYNYEGADFNIDDNKFYYWE